ncbi:TraG family conjugative transposon ATPase [Pinibacter aurantiacus]|uniref:TraG family conjugative transposon ATPase n=1 Tax=Pinibacter aurantiacus TaxID=2851599 RepID=A0A9E2SET3_9BACT|nr:TraG family conjugative transposon ATPase [Pinibacter aurantiacus]MBV4358795.1 TraG family conjugative transposon ATPase [Pinibacter aurantiacus]
MEKILQDILPIMDVENDCILSKQGDICITFKLLLPEIFTLSGENYEALHQAFIKAIKVLPAGSVLHKQDWFIEANYQPTANDVEENESFLHKASDRFFTERPYLDHHCYAMLIKKASTKSTTTLLSSLTRPKLVPEQTIHPIALQSFEAVASQFASILSEAGIKCQRLTENDLLSSSTHCGLIEQYCSLHEFSGNPALKDIQLKPLFTIGSNTCQLFTLADQQDLPTYCSSKNKYDKYSSDKTKFAIGFAAPLGLLLPCNHVFNQYIFIEDAQATIKKMESKRLRLQSLSAYSRENAISKEAVNEFLNECIREQRSPVKAHFNVMLWAEDKERLKDMRNMATTAFAQLDAIAKEETVGMPQIYWAGIPGNAGDFPMNDTFDTFAEQACCFLNVETNYQNSISPVGIRFGDRLSGKPVHVDISDEPIRKGICTNRNKFILGPSGSGKSFLTNHLMRTYYEQGSHIVIVDVGHSYKGLCDMVSGYYFTYDEKKPICFNPFYIADGDTLDTEKKESIKTLLLALWKKDNESFNRSEYVALSNALQGYYDKLEKQPGIFACFNSFYEYVSNEFVQVLTNDKVKEKDFDVTNFLYVLRPYYAGGEFDYLLNATENLDLLTEHFIVFELDNIKDHPILFPVVTIIIMEVFISKMRKLKGIRKIILIEEAWKAIAKEGMAEYIKYLFKTVRKFFGEAIVVTQEVEDIISSPIVKQAIINNSDCKILLDQSKYQNKFDQIQELLGLTQKEKALVLSVNKANDPDKKYKEVFISLGGVLSKVYRTEVSPEEYFAYTTEETEKVKVQQYAKQYGSLEKGIAALASESSKPF